MSIASPPPASPDDERSGTVRIGEVLDLGEGGQEGVPIFRSPKDGKAFGGAWGKAKVKFFWPEKKE